MSYLLKWWLVFSLVIVSTGIFIYSGYWTVVLARDITYLSFVVIAITILASISIGINGWKAYKSNTLMKTDYYWFIADNNLVIGLVGTLIGFIYLFSQIDLTTLNLSNPVAMQKLVTVMVTGLGTKLYATLFGLFGERLIKYQLMIWESYNDAKSKV